MRQPQAEEFVASPVPGSNQCSLLEPYNLLYCTVTLTLANGFAVWPVCTVEVPSTSIFTTAGCGVGVGVGTGVGVGPPPPPVPPPPPQAAILTIPSRQMP